MITTLTVKDFRAIRGTRAYPLPAGVAAFIGANERGKTSSLLALAWGLYGSQALPDGITSDDIINDHATECRVQVEFIHDGDQYELERWQRRDGRGDATLTGPKSASGRAPVTKAITELFGVDHAGFMVSVFARQDELDALAGKQGAARVSMMLRLLGVDQADAALKGIRKQLNEERRALELLRAGMVDVDALTLERESSQRSLIELRDQHEEAQKADQEAQVASVLVAAEMRAHVAKVQEFEAWRQKQADAEGQLALVKARQVEAHKRKVEVPRPPLTVGDPPVGLDEAQATYDALRQRWAALDAQKKSLTDELAQLADVCTACMRPFDNAEEVQVRRGVLTTQIEAVEKDEAEAWAQGQMARTKLDEAKGSLSRYQIALDDFLRAQREIDQAIKTNVDAEQAIGLLEVEVEAATAALAQINLEAVPDPRTERDSLNAKVTEVQTLQMATLSRMATLAEAVRSMESNISRIDDALGAAQGKQDESKAKERTVLTLDVAATEMAAMKERLIARVIPALQERASTIVSELTDGKHAELRLTPDYEIQYVTETGQLRSFANLSGGAQDVFALALRLAIAELRAGSVSFLVLDEVFESMDDDRQALAWAAIERLGKRYQQVLVITHVAALKERAATVIEV